MRKGNHKHPDNNTVQKMKHCHRNRIPNISDKQDVSGGGFHSMPKSLHLPVMCSNMSIFCSRAEEAKSKITNTSVAVNKDSFCKAQPKIARRLRNYQNYLK